MDTLDGIPMQDVPPGVMGSTDRHRRLNILVSSDGQVRRIGKLLFGKKDASFYIFLAGRDPIVEVGTAISHGGRLVPISRSNNTDVPMLPQSGIHVSLHPSGEVHVKTSARDVITAASVVLHSDDILSRAARARATLARMSSALAVHVKDSGFWLCSAI